MHIDGAERIAKLRMPGMKRRDPRAIDRRIVFRDGQLRPNAIEFRLGRRQVAKPQPKHDRQSQNGEGKDGQINKQSRHGAEVSRGP